METTQAVRLAGKEHYNALKNRKEELERVIEEKEAELRRIKLQEAVSYCAETFVMILELFEYKSLRLISPHVLPVTAVANRVRPGHAIITRPAGSWICPTARA